MPEPRTALCSAIAGALAAAALAACAGDPAGWTARDPYTWVATGATPLDAPARNPDGSANALIEIPAGTNAKWEVREADGALAWEIEDGRPRVVSYLAYPVNYGMIPRTRLAAEAGGDGDPLDVLVLGPALARGSLVPVRVIGVLRLLDDGERDDKLLAVTDGPPFGAVRDLPDLEQRFPGATRILEIWFAHYKGAGRIETRGFGDAAEASAVLDLASEPHATR